MPAGRLLGDRWNMGLVGEYDGDVGDHVGDAGEYDGERRTRMHGRRGLGCSSGWRASTTATWAS